MKKRFIVFISLLLVTAILLSSCSNIETDNSMMPENSNDVSEYNNGNSDENSKENGVEHIHNYGDWITIQTPTCSENGYAESSCSCGQKMSKTIYSFGHDYGEWTIIKSASCSEEGSQQKECKKCGAVEKQVIAPAHEYKVSSAKEETCESQGINNYVCKQCGDKYTEYINAVGHSWNPATCTNAKTCVHCGKTEGKALGHKFDGWFCTQCGKEKNSKIDISKRLKKILLFSGVYGYMMLMIKFEKVDCTDVDKYKFYINLYDSNGQFYTTTTYTISNDSDEYLTRLLCFGRGNYNKFTAEIRQIDFYFNDGTSETATVEYSQKLRSSVSLEDIDLDDVVWFD